MNFKKFNYYYDIDENGLFKDINQIINFQTPIVFALLNNSKKLYLTTKEIDYLIKNTDYKIHKNKQFNFGNELSLIFKLNKTSNFNLNKKQLLYIIEKTDLSKKDCFNKTLFHYALNNNKKENLNFSLEELYFLYKKQNKDDLILNDFLYLKENNIKYLEFLEYKKSYEEKLAIINILKKENDFNNVNAEKKYNKI